MIQTQKRKPVDLMEYRLHKKMKAIGMECLYDENGSVRMWIRISPKANKRLFHKLTLLKSDV